MKEAKPPGLTEVLGAKGNHKFGYGAASVEGPFWGGSRGEGCLSLFCMGRSWIHLQGTLGPVRAPCLVGPKCNETTEN